MYDLDCLLKFYFKIRFYHMYFTNFCSSLLIIMKGNYVICGNIYREKLKEKLIIINKIKNK